MEPPDEITNAAPLIMMLNNTSHVSRWPLNHLIDRVPHRDRRLRMPPIGPGQHVAEIRQCLTHCAGRTHTLRRQQRSVLTAGLLLRQ